MIIYVKLTPTGSSFIINRNNMCGLLNLNWIMQTDYNLQTKFSFFYSLKTLTRWKAWLFTCFYHYVQSYWGSKNGLAVKLQSYIRNRLKLFTFSSMTNFNIYTDDKISVWNQRWRNMRNLPLNNRLFVGASRWTGDNRGMKLDFAVKRMTKWAHIWLAYKHALLQILT